METGEKQREHEHRALLIEEAVSSSIKDRGVHKSRTKFRNSLLVYVRSVIDL